MWKVSALTVGMATFFVALARPATAHAQYAGDGWSRGGLGNILFDRWVDNRRAAHGIPTTQLYYYDPEEGDGILNRLFDRWIDNRRAARGMSTYGNGFESPAHAQDTKPGGSAKVREPAQTEDVEPTKKNFWIDPVTRNQYYVGVQNPADTKKNPAPPDGAAVPKLPPGTPPPINLPGQPQHGIALRLPGEVEASEQVDLYARIAGSVEKVHVDIGDRVKKGQVLAELAVPEVEAEYRQKQAGVAQAKAEVEAAAGAMRASRAGLVVVKAQIVALEAEIKRSQSEFALRKAQVGRMEELFNVKAVEQKIVDEARARVETAKAAVDAAEAKVLGGKAAVEESQAKFAKTEADQKVAEAKLLVVEAELQRTAVLIKYARVRAPFDGVITRRSADGGTFAQAPEHGNTVPLFVVARTNMVRVVVNVSDDAVTRLRKGTRAVIQLDARKGEQFEGKIVRISGAMDRTNRTLRAEIDLPNPDGKILPGMFGTVSLMLEK